MKQVSFITSNQRAQQLHSIEPFADVVITSKNGFSTIMLTYSEHNEQLVFLAIFHAGIMQGLKEAFNN